MNGFLFLSLRLHQRNDERKLKANNNRPVEKIGYVTRNKQAEGMKASGFSSAAMMGKQDPDQVNFRHINHHVVVIFGLFMKILMPLVVVSCISLSILVFFFSLSILILSLTRLYLTCAIRIWMKNLRLGCHACVRMTARLTQAWRSCPARLTPWATSAPP